MLHQVGVASACDLLPGGATATAVVLEYDLVVLAAAGLEVEHGNLLIREGWASGTGSIDHSSEAGRVVGGLCRWVA